VKAPLWMQTNTKRCICKLIIGEKRPFKNNSKDVNRKS
jgi:hypothetical protein